MLALVRRGQQKRLRAVDLTAVRVQGIHDESHAERPAEHQDRKVVVVARSLPDCCKGQFEVVMMQLACQQAVEQTTANLHTIFDQTLDGQEGQQESKNYSIS